MPRRKMVRGSEHRGSAIDMATGATVPLPSLPVLCERIRYYRKKIGMEQKALAEKVGAAPNAVCNWENGRNRPDISLLPAICDALGVTLQDLFGVDPLVDPLTDREKRLLDRFRELDPGDRRIVETMMKAMLTVRQAKERQKSSRKVYELPLAGKDLAAGIGDPTEYGEETTPFYLYEVPQIDRADYVFRVSGSSMEPDYPNGSFVLVERLPGGPDLRIGEIGVFSLADELLIKQYGGPEGLISLNPAFEPIKPYEDTPIYIIGRVLRLIAPEETASEDDVEKFLLLKE